MRKTSLVLIILIIAIVLTFGCDEPICGNSICETGENIQNCSIDCGNTYYCGDGICQENETYETCSKDCGSLEPQIFGKWYSIPTPGTNYFQWDINKTNAVLTDFSTDTRLILDVNYYDNSKISFTGTYDLQFDYNVEIISNSEKILTLIHPFNYQKLINKPKDEITDYEYCGNLYCRVNESIENCLADCGDVQFKTFMENGQDNKINLLFIFNKYQDKELIESDIEKFVDIEDTYDGLFSYSPLKENINNFNIYYTDFNLNCYPSGNIQHGTGEDCVNIADHLAIMTDSEIVAVILDMNDAINLGLGGRKRITMARLTGPVGEYRLATGVLAHEFGHAFVNLGDEYVNYSATIDLSERPNIDIAGCPKWCSGDLNTMVPRFDDFNNFMICAKEVTNNFDDFYTEDPWTGICGDHPGNYSFENVDLGLGCREGTGCYWNSKGITNYRSSETSVMKHPSNISGFNIISQEAILKHINELIN